MLRPLRQDTRPNPSFAWGLFPWNAPRVLWVPFVVLAAGAASCASREPNVKVVDTTLESKGSTGTQLVGLDGKGDAVLQQEQPLGAEIRTAQHVNENLRMNVKTEFFHLKTCWKSRARGTTGEMPELNELSDLEAGVGPTEEVGLVGGEIKVVRKEDAVVRLRTEKRFQEELRAHLANVKRQREKCEFEAARDVVGSRHAVE